MCSNTLRNLTTETDLRVMRSGAIFGWISFKKLDTHHDLLLDVFYNSRKVITAWIFFVNKKGPQIILIVFDNLRIFII